MADVAAREHQLSRNLTAMEPSSLVLVGAVVVILVALVVAGRVSRLGAVTWRSRSAELPVAVPAAMRLIFLQWP